MNLATLRNGSDFGEMVDDCLRHGVTAISPWRDQVHEALLGLGWSARDADAALERVAAEIEPGATPDVSTVLRDALRSLSKAR